MQDPDQSDVIALNDAISALMRRFKIAESTSSKEQGVRLNPIDVESLLFLAAHPDSTASALGQYLDVAATTVSAVIDRLVRQGFLRRDRIASNRRIVQLNLTEAGEDKTQQIIRFHQANSREMLMALDPAERGTFVALMRKIVSSS